MILYVVSSLGMILYVVSSSQTTVWRREEWEIRYDYSSYVRETPRAQFSSIRLGIRMHPGGV